MGTKTLTAREVELYDADTFDEFKKVSAIQGHTAYQGDDKDEVILSAQTSGMGIPGSPTAPETAEQGGMSGPIFIRYEEGAAADTTPAPQ